VNWTLNAERLRPVASATAVLLLCCLAPAAASGQRRQAGPAPRLRYVQRENPRQNQRQAQRQQRQYQNQQRRYQAQQRPAQQNPQSYGGQRNTPANGARLGSQGPAYSRPAYPNASNAERPQYNYPGASRPGHLGGWLNQHQGLPLQDQERLLRSDPSFNRLPPATQQRLLDQLHRLNQMPEAERERTLARGEMLERLSPQEQMQVREAGRQLVTLPPDRQEVVKRAFQDLRSVPLDQRATVLNSARYQSNFSPEERNILSNLLRAEPYEPPR
jgi:hypothetical protein